ncbi:MAG: ribosomal L7Ae/L30e/S12e/Gadd45 family protein [Oscillospiraceae bacterium]|nr:ribosomal L7Ae/L30e/S12e/Gadd45 family protein [Oscillospiraceae bacterium]
MSKFLQTLGLARRAGRAIFGIDTVAANTRTAQLIVLANDAGIAVSRRAARIGAEANVEIITAPYTSVELGQAIGTQLCAVAAITEKGFATSISYELKGPRAGMMRR